MRKNETINLTLHVAACILLFCVSVYLTRDWGIKESLVIVGWTLLALTAGLAGNFAIVLKGTETTGEEDEKTNKLIDIFWGQGFPTKRWENPATVIESQERKMRQIL